MAQENIFQELTAASEEVTMQTCFERFIQEGNSYMTIYDLQLLLTQLFVNKYGGHYDLTSAQFDIVLETFCLKENDRIELELFQKIYSRLIAPIFKPKTSLIVVDVQNDFIDGTLAIKNCPASQEGSDVIPVINNLLQTVTFDLVIYTHDWHPENHISFIENIGLHKVHSNSPVTAKDAKVFDTVIFEGPPKYEQKLWPRHCVQNTWGARLHQNLTVVDNALLIYKGTDPDIDSYSAFGDNQKRSQTNLAQDLKDRNITHVFVCGLAYDYCVGFTGLHALENDFVTIMIENAVRGCSQEGIDEMKNNLTSNHGVIVNSDQVFDIVSGWDRFPEFIYSLIKSNRNS